MNASITHPLNLIVIIVGCFLSLGLGFFLLLNKKNKANPFLGVLILTISTYFLTGFFDRFDLLVHAPHIIGIGTVTSFLMGPLSYLYVCACTQKEFQLHRLSWLHFLPFILDVLFFTPFFLKTGGEKVDLFVNYKKTGDLQQPHFLLVLKAVQCIAYIALAIRLILKYRKHLNNTSSTIDHAFHRWMGIFLFLMTFPIFGLIGFVVLDFQRILITIALMSLFSFLLVVFIMMLVKPEVFQAFPHQMAIADMEEEEYEKYEKYEEHTKYEKYEEYEEHEKYEEYEKYEEHEGHEKYEEYEGHEKYEESTLDTNKEDYLDKLIAYMEREKPYLSPDLTIDELSEQVRIPANPLSQVINKKLNVHFLDFINGYRIKEVKEKLADPQLSHLTIMAIAYDTGFSAKSTFYAVFKKNTGQTPSEYRKLTAAMAAIES